MSDSVAFRIAASGWVVVALMLGGCTSTRTPPSKSVFAATAPTAADLRLQAAIDARVAELLSRPLTEDDAVETALLRNPTLTRLFDRLGLANDRLKLAHQPDPRHDGRPLGGEEPRIEHASTATLMSWLASASLIGFDSNANANANANSNANANADNAMQLGIAADQAGAITFDVRRAWVDAVAAGQRLRVEADAVLAAQTARGLAERQWQVGNQPLLNALQAQQAEALALEKRSALRAFALVAQERLHAAMGLFFDDADAVQLPPGLPALPAHVVPADALELRAVSQRLDVQAARLASTLPVPAAQASSTPRSPVIVDTHLHSFEYPEEAGLRARREVRSAWVACAAAHEQAMLHANVLVPLAIRISDEQTKRANGMLIGLDTLLADATSRTAAVSASIEAQRRYWRADADLQQAMAGVGQVEVMVPDATHSTGTDH